MRINKQLNQKNDVQRILVNLVYKENYELILDDEKYFKIQILW